MQALAKDLSHIVGSAGVLTAPEDLLPYESDALPFQRLMPGMVVLPESAPQVAQVARLLSQAAVPFLARGSGTSLSGSSIAAADAVIIGLARMNRLLAIDLPNRCITVQAGCVNKMISDALAPSGWQFAPDPSSQTVCTIGGNIAHNAGGPHTLKHGVTANHVLALELVLPDGAIAHLGSPCEINAGYDLRGVVIGSEGMTGIVTQATLRLTRLPQAARTTLAVFDSIDAACAAITAVIASGLIPGALEMIDNLMLRAFEAAYHVGLPTEAAAAVILEVEGMEAAVDDDLQRAIGAMRARGARDLRTAADEAERAALWKVRKSAGGSLGRSTPSYYTLDGCVPRSRITQALRAFYAIGEKHGIPVGNAFHAGDGNLHPYLIYDDRVPAQREAVLDAAHEMLAACVALDGTITGEHGVGLEKASLMPHMFTPLDIAAMRAVRHAFDPHERCNPGKVFPVQPPAALAPEAPAPAAPPGPSQITTAASGIVGRAHVVHDPAARAPVLNPGSAGQVAQVLQWAHLSRVAVVPRGGDTAAPVSAAGPDARVVLSTQRLNLIIRHEPADLTITAQAGITIAALQQALNRAGQFLPLDPPLPERATLGGVIAANSAGPLRCAHGTPRDMLAQVRFILAGGGMVKSGAQSLKNSAGLDLGRLIAGSLGTLGVIVEATLRVLPLPETEAALAASFADVRRAAQAAARLRAGDAAPAFLELLSPSFASAELVGGLAAKHCLVAGFMGSAKSVACRLDLARGLLADEGTDAAQSLSDATVRARLAQLHAPAGLSCRACLPPASLGTLLHDAESSALGYQARYICHAASGLADIFLDPDLPQARIISLLGTLRSAANGCGGALTVTSAPAWLPPRFDPWGDPPPGLEIMKAIKQRLDPSGVMNPGVLCGGI